MSGDLKGRAAGASTVQNGAELPPLIGMDRVVHGSERQRLLAGAPVTVLVVDDEPVLLRTAQRALEQRGLVVTCVDSAEAALELLASGRSFDLLITDVGLRRMNGMELARRARVAQPSLRVLYVSGFDAESVGFDRRGSCADGFLAKPYTARELDDRLRDLLLPGS